MGRTTSTHTGTWSWFYLPVIIGVIVDAAVSSMTDRWWWVTVGTVLGGVVGEVARRRYCR